MGFEAKLTNLTYYTREGTNTFVIHQGQRQSREIFKKKFYYSNPTVPLYY
jgi:hypothetical protein